MSPQVEPRNRLSSSPIISTVDQELGMRSSRVYCGIDVNDNHLQEVVEYDESLGVVASVDLQVS